MSKPMTKTQAKWFKTKLEQATHRQRNLYDVYKAPSAAKVWGWTRAMQIIADFEEQFDGYVTTVTVSSYNTFMFTVTAIIKGMHDEYIVVVTPEQTRTASIMEILSTL